MEKENKPGKMRIIEDGEEKFINIKKPPADNYKRIVARRGRKGMPRRRMHR